jgi:aminoglycoside phosphotransferase (APT) family kinase protein
MRPFPQITPKFVAQNVLTALNGSGSSADWIVQGPLHFRHASERHAPAFIFKVKRPHQQTSLCVKIFVSFGRPLEEAIQEFKALQTRYQASKASGDFRVPEPIALVESQNAIVMEWIEGRNLQKVLIRQALSRARQQDCLREAGRWLRAMHASSKITYEVFDYESMTNTVNDRIASLIPPLPPNSKLRKCAHFFEAVSTRLDRSPMPHTVLHDDFAPRNLIVASGKMAAIDISTLNNGPVCRDHAEFMLYYDLFDPVGIVTRTTSCSNGRLAAFFESYDGAWTSNVPDWILFRYMFTLLSMWISMTEWHRGTVWRKSLLFVPFDRFMVMTDRCARVLSARVQRTSQNAY